MSCIYALLTLLLGDGVGVDGGGEDTDWLCGSVLGIDRNLFNGIEGRINAVDDFCKDGVLCVEMRLFVVGDEEL